VVVDVGLFFVVSLFVFLAVVMAVGQQVVVVRVAMPEGTMVPLGKRITPMVVRNVVVIMSMGLGWMVMRGLLAFAFGPLYSHRTLLLS